MKAQKFSDSITKFEDLPNVGKRVANDFRTLGLKKPADLKNKNPLALYKKLCKITNSYQDPCVLDTFMAVVDFVNGASARPWWHYTPERKKMLQ